MEKKLPCLRLTESNFWKNQKTGTNSNSMENYSNLWNFQTKNKLTNFGKISEVMKKFTGINKYLKWQTINLFQMEFRKLTRTGLISIALKIKKMNKKKNNNNSLIQQEKTFKNNSEANFSFNSMMIQGQVNRK